MTISVWWDVKPCSVNLFSLLSALNVFLNSRQRQVWFILLSVIMTLTLTGTVFMVLRCMTVTVRVHLIHLINVEHRQAFANIYINHLVLLGPKAGANSSVSQRIRPPVICVIAA